MEIESHNWLEILHIKYKFTMHRRLEKNLNIESHMESKNDYIFRNIF